MSYVKQFLIERQKEVCVWDFLFLFVTKHKWTLINITEYHRYLLIASTVHWKCLEEKKMKNLSFSMGTSGDIEKKYFIFSWVSVSISQWKKISQNLTHYSLGDVFEIFLNFVRPRSIPTISEWMHLIYLSRWLNDISNRISILFHKNLTRFIAPIFCKLIKKKLEIIWGVFS